MTAILNDKDLGIMRQMATAARMSRQPGTGRVLDMAVDEITRLKALNEALIAAAQRVVDEIGPDEGTEDLIDDTSITVHVGGRATYHGLTLGELRALSAAIANATEGAPR